MGENKTECLPCGCDKASAERLHHQYSESLLAGHRYVGPKQRVIHYV